jgi:protein-tyrosine phosphatase
MNEMDGLVDRLMKIARPRTAGRALKRAVRNAVWQVRGRSVSNPRLPPQVRGLLFVCKGNICRSPFAAMLAAKLLQASGRGEIRCTSAGIEPSRERVSPEAAVASARNYDVQLRPHTAVRLTEALMASHDVIIVMEPAQLDRVRLLWPAYRDRVFLLSLFGTPARQSYDRFHIADPYGKTVDVFDICYARIYESVAALIAQLPASVSTRL